MVSTEAVVVAFGAIGASSIRLINGAGGAVESAFALEVDWTEGQVADEDGWIPFDFINIELDERLGCNSVEERDTLSPMVGVVDVEIDEIWFGGLEVRAVTTSAEIPPPPAAAVVVVVVGGGSKFTVGLGLVS